MKFWAKHIAMFFLLLIGAGRMSAQESLLDKVYERLSSSCAEITYKYTSEVSGTKLNGSGVLQLQGNLWHNDGNGLVIWCDGKTVWTADMLAEEVIIDSVTDDGNDDLTNPALMFVRMNELFNLKKTVEGKDGLTRVFILEPKSDVGIEYFNVEILKSDATIRSASFALEDGNEVKLTISSMSYLQKKPVSAFRPSQTFDSSWIVTDLR